MKMRSQILTLTVDPGQEAQSVGLRRGCDLASEIFRVNGLLKTFPVQQLDLLAPLPVNPDLGLSPPPMEADTKILHLDPLPYDLLDLSAPQTVSITLSHNVFATDSLRIHLQPYVLGPGDNWTYVRDKSSDLRVEEVVTGTGEISIPVVVPARSTAGDAQLWIDMIFETDLVSRGGSGFLKYAVTVP